MNGWKEKISPNWKSGFQAFEANLHYLGAPSFHESASSKPKNTALKFNSSPLKIGKPKRKLIFQPSFFRGELFNFGGVVVFVNLQSEFLVFHLNDCARHEDFGCCDRESLVLPLVGLYYRVAAAERRPFVYGC